MSLPRIAIDVMGNDSGVHTMVSGAALAQSRNEDQKFLLVGDEPQIKQELDQHPNLRAACEVLHADGIITDQDRPSQALRRAQNTSMGMAINALKAGEVGAVVSGGNTGALMTVAKSALRTIPGIDRPTLAGLMPTLGTNDLVMLDVGANTECDDRDLLQFAIMGAAYARIAHNLSLPRVRLLNIGSEDIKGTVALRSAATQLKAAARELELSFDGFIEADKLSCGEVDVVVSDGFAGNVALKAVEGMANFMAIFLRRSFASSLRLKLGFLISRPATQLVKYHLDPNNHNGAIFLGLNGIVVKSDGNSSELGVANAVRLTSRLLADNLTSRIANDLERIKRKSVFPDGRVCETGSD